MKMIIMTIGIAAAAPIYAQAVAQTETAPSPPSVEIRTGPDGQLTGRASSGGALSGVATGRAAAAPNPAASSRSPCPPGTTGQSVRVVSPDGASSASSSVSTSGNGVVATGGAGSPGSRITEERCGPNASTGRVDARVDARVNGIAPH